MNNRNIVFLLKFLLESYNKGSEIEGVDNIPKNVKIILKEAIKTKNEILCQKDEIYKEREAISTIVEEEFLQEIREYDETEDIIAEDFLTILLYQTGEKATGKIIRKSINRFKSFYTEIIQNEETNSFKAFIAEINGEYFFKAIYQYILLNQNIIFRIATLGKTQNRISYLIFGLERKISKKTRGIEDPFTSYELDALSFKLGSLNEAKKNYIEAKKYLVKFEESFLFPKKEDK